MTSPKFDTELQRVAASLKHQLPCCVNCEHGISMRHDNAAKHQCDLAPGAGLPPPTIIAFGCPAFSGDIPF